MLIEASNRTAKGYTKTLLELRIIQVSTATER